MAATTAPTLEARFAEATLRFDLARKRQLELQQLIKSSPWTNSRFEEAFDKIVSARDCPNQTKEQIAEANKIFDDFVKKSSAGKIELQAARDELDTFPKQENWEGIDDYLKKWLNSLMKYEVGDFVMCSRFRCAFSGVILEKEFKEEFEGEEKKWNYTLQLDGVVFKPNSIEDIFKTTHEYIEFRAEEEGDREKRAAWPSILLKMKQEAWVAQMKAPAEKQIAEARAVIAEANEIATFPTRFAHIIPGTRCWWIDDGYAGYQKYTSRCDGTITSINLITFKCEISCDSREGIKTTRRIDTLNF